MRKSSKVKAKEKAWEAFSAYVRARDKSRGCCTCRGEVQQAGHFIDGRHNAVLFSERGVHGQCYHCNVGLKGNKLEYWLFMEREYGREVIDELMAESKTTVQYKEHDYLSIADEYKEKLAELTLK